MTTVLNSNTYVNPRVKYLVCPGDVISATDGQGHFIGSSKLMMLYNVDPRDCLILPNDTFVGPDSNLNKLIPLFPRHDGNYPDYRNPANHPAKES